MENLYAKDVIIKLKVRELIKMPIVMRIKGLDRTRKFFAQLPEQLNKDTMKTSDKFMRFVQKSAKLRAPRFTGKLAQSIIVIKRKNEIILIVDSPYGIFQEKGYRPHWVQIWRSTRAGLTITDWVETKGVRTPFWRNSIFVSSYKPFIAPALESGLNQLPSWLNQSTKQAIIKAGG